MYLSIKLFSSVSAYLIGFLICLIVYPIIFKKRGFKYIDGFIIVFLQVIFAFIFAAIFASIESGVTRYIGVSYYGTIFTLFIIPLIYSLIRKLNYYYVIDTIAPIHILMLVFMKIGCFIEGCCIGISINGTRIPIQIIEAFLALIIYVSIYILKDKLKGYVYQYILIVYGFVRFIIEFFRFHNELLFGVISFGQLWSIVAVLIGLITLLIKKKYLTVDY